MATQNYKSDFSYKDRSTILLENRIIMLVGEVNEALAYQVTSAMHILAKESNDPIQLFINSPGGSVCDGLSIIDTMNFIKCPVYTICCGLAASMGSAILVSGEPGHRMSLPNSEIMFHQVSTQSAGNINDIRVAVQQSERVNGRMAKIICDACGLSVEEYTAMTQRDKYLWPEEALHFGTKGAIDFITTQEAK